jgi:hypothetical protein
MEVCSISLVIDDGNDEEYEIHGGESNPEECLVSSEQEKGQYFDGDFEVVQETVRIN